MEKVKQWSWSETAYKVDPQLSAPVVTYKFNNGARISSVIEINTSNGRIIDTPKRKEAVKNFPGS